MTQRREVMLMLIREGTGGCEHRTLTWGFDPGVVTCSCGARWRAALLTADEHEAE